MDNEKILARLDIKSKWTKLGIACAIACCVAGVVPFLIPIIANVTNGGMVMSMPPIIVLHTVIMILIPVILKLFSQSIANSCQLELTENQIKGQLKMPFSTKKLQMPIDKLDNVFTSNGLADKFRSGETVIIHSNSGAVKFHYVHNAEEFARVAMKRIEEARKENSVQSCAPPVQNTVPASSLTEKIAELQSLKAQGVLTEEQFEAKKQDLIAKF